MLSPAACRTSGANQRELALAHIQTLMPPGVKSAQRPPCPTTVDLIMLRKVMSKRPNDRYRHADQLGQVLRRARERVKYGVAVTIPTPAPNPDVSVPRPSPPPSPAPLPRPRMGTRPLLEATGAYTGPLLPQRQPKPQRWDAVTLILMILALLAVAGLLPLYLFGVFPLLG